MLANIICNINITIQDVMKLIDKNGKGTVILVDNEGILKGVITDGDIRRGLLAGYGLNEPIRQLVKDECVYAYNGTDVAVLAELCNEKINIIPLVDENKKVVDFFQYKKALYVPIASPCLEGNEFKYLMDAFLSTWISSTGKYINEFEQKFAEYCGCDYGVAVSNGTTALHLALVALGIGEGDEVIIPDITFAATINAVLYTGATPVIVDIEEDGWCISPIEIEKAITDKTKAIIPVHIYGQPCDMKAIMEIAEKNNIYVVEDCAEAHGAEFNDKKVGSFGDISCFSFFANKVITTGEGGMCITNNKVLNDKMRILRDHGMSRERKYYHEVVGFNYRMTNLQAAIGVAQIEQIDKILQWREDLENHYYTELKDIKDIEFQKKDLPGRKKIPWLITVTVPEDKRDSCVKALKESDIDTRAFFIPLSEMDIYKKYKFSNSISTEISKKGFNLPTKLGVDKETIKKIANILREVLN